MSISRSRMGLSEYDHIMGPDHGSLYVRVLTVSGKA